MTFRVLIENCDVNGAISFCKQNAEGEYSYKDLYDYFDETLNRFAFFFKNEEDAKLLAERFQAPIRELS